MIYAQWLFVLGLTTALAAPTWAPLDSNGIVRPGDTIDSSVVGRVGEVLAGDEELVSAPLSQEERDQAKAPIDNMSIYEGARWRAYKKQQKNHPSDKPHWYRGLAIDSTEDMFSTEMSKAEAADQPPKSHAGSSGGREGGGKGGRKKEYEEDEYSVQDDEEEEAEEERPHGSGRGGSRGHYGNSRHSAADDAEYYNDAVEHVLRHACANRAVKEQCELGAFKGKCLEKSGIKLCSP